MQLSKLRKDIKYKVFGRPEMKIVRYTSGSGEYEETTTIPSNTTLIVRRVNAKSVRVILRFKDKNKEGYAGRLTFADNPGQFDIKAPLDKE